MEETVCFQYSAGKILNFEAIKKEINGESVEFRDEFHGKESDKPLFSQNS